MRLHKTRALLAAGALLVAGCGTGAAPSGPGGNAAGTAAMSADRRQDDQGQQPRSSSIRERRR